jgi:hypothetical protein
MGHCCRPGYGWHLPRVVAQQASPSVVAQQTPPTLAQHAPVVVAQ